MESSLPRRIFIGALALGIFAMEIPPSASAQTTYNATLNNMVQNVYGAIFPNTSPHYDAINFATGNGTLLWVDQDVSFTGSTLSNVFTSTTFTSDTGARVSASMLGTDEMLTPVDGRTFIVQNFALDNVDFTTSTGNATGDVGLRIQGPGGLNTSLTLANSSLNCSLAPHFYVPSALTFNVSGTSQITGWGHDPTVGVASTTTLTVASGGAFTIKDSGSLTSGATYQQRLFFNQYSNTATLNGSSLIIDQSALVFGANPFGNPGDESTMTFSSNATLQLTSVGTPGSSIETDNIVFQNSTLNMGSNTLLKLRNTLELDSSQALLATGAQAEALVLVAKGNATVSLANFSSLKTSTLDIRSGATMALVESGDDIAETTVSHQVLFPASGVGTLNVGSRSVLNLTSLATMDLTSHAVLTNNGSINLQNGQMTVRQGSTFTNNTELIVQDASSLNIDGNVTIGGHGTFNTTGTLSFTNSPATPAVNTLTVYGIGLQSPVGSLTSNSTLQMALNPTGLTADQLIVSHQLDLESRVALSLSVVSDTALALGTKFLLVNYPSWQAFPSTHFNGLPDGAAFALGLNIYQINYNDPDVQPGESHFITVTTVPEPGTIALLGLGAFALAGSALRRRA